MISKAATSVNTFFSALRETTQRKIAGGNLVPRASDTDLWLIPVIVSHADGTEHSPRRSGFNAIGDGSGTGLGVDLAHGCESTWRAKTLPLGSENEGGTEGKSNPLFLFRRKLGGKKRIDNLKNNVELKVSEAFWQRGNTLRISLHRCISQDGDEGVHKLVREPTKNFIS